MKWLKILLGNLLVLILLIAVIELAARMILHQIYHRHFDSSLLIENKYFNSAGLKPNASGMVWNKKLTTDEYGGRVTHQSKAKKKWLYLGDSVTEGVGVGDSSDFTYLVSTLDSSYRYVNLSLIGYSTADYLNILKSVVGKDSSVTHATIFFCLNDVYGSAKTQDLPVMAQQNWKGRLNALLQNRSATYKLLKLLVYQHSDSYYRYDASFYTLENKYFQQAMQQLYACDSICRTNRIAMNVVVLPYRSQLKNPNRNHPQILLHQYCERLHIAFRDALPFLSRQPDPTSLYLFADEIHFSAKGHRAVAKYLTLQNYE